MRSRLSPRTAVLSSVAAIAAMLVLVSCTVPQPKPSASPTDTKTPSATPTPSETPFSLPLTEPGSELGIGEWATLPLTNIRDEDASIMATVSRIDEASPAVADLIRDNEPRLADSQIYFIWIDIKKSEGGALEFEDTFSDFRVIDSEHAVLQTLSLFGNEECPAVSFPRGFDESEEGISTCLAAAVPNGEAPPAGAMFAPFRTEYGASAGKPVLWVTPADDTEATEDGTAPEGTTPEGTEPEIAE